MKLKLYNLFIIPAALLAFFTPVSAQISGQRIIEEPCSGAGIFRPYFHRDDIVTSAPPKGYRPFYISHFGRHGSRYHSRQQDLKPAFECFSAAAQEGILTPKGDSLYSAIKAIYEEHEGMYGELAPLGAREHRGIAARMYGRHRSVFTSDDRNEVRCVSSVYSRCLMSMANFTEELSSLAPSLDISYVAGRRYNDKYMNARMEYDFSRDADAVIDSLKKNHLHPEVLIPVYFTDYDRAAAIMEDGYAVEMGIYGFWAISYDLDFLSLDLTSLIPSDELVSCCAIENATRYAKVCISEEFGKYTRIKGVRLLKDFVSKADEALADGSRTAADLRFAHDSGFLPMCALLGIDGYPVYSIEEAYGSWNAADVIPMCSNLQMIFYKGRGEVLVKVLVNETEVRLGGLTPVQGVYYLWNDVRNMIEKL